MDKGRTRPRFSPGQQNNLLQRLRLTRQQVDALDRGLPAIADWLLPRPRAGDVRDQLTRMAELLEGAEALLRRWRAASRDTAGKEAAMAEALGHFGMAGGPLVRGSAGIDIDDSLDPASIITMAAYIARKAADNGPGHGPRRSMIMASPQAIKRIVEALHRPRDEYSRQRASELKPSRSRRSDFYRLACVVWEAAFDGAATGQSAPQRSPARSIQAYLRTT